MRLYEGGLPVAARDSVHLKRQGEELVPENVGSRDELVTSATRLTFRLDYPFERPFDGVVEGQLTLRRIIDAIRAGFDVMYAGTTQEDVAGMYNKKVSGRFGTAVHVMSDLFIEAIDQHEDGSVVIEIGS